VLARGLILRLDGWGEIAARLTEHAGVPVSKDQARRYAHRRENPLPVLRIGRLLRRRIVAEREHIDAWAKREFLPDSVRA
jgi:hypothetical protein